jgi:hypothetical protein
MLTSLNKKLISRYPLLWNTRIIQCLTALAIIHLLFYAAGMLTEIPMEKLWWYHTFNLDQVIILSALVSLLFVILWLVQFLRNNPFKSYYSLGPGYLYAEFILLFIVFLFSSTFFLSYQQGLYEKGRRVTRDIDIKTEADKANIARHFIVVNADDFSKKNSCELIREREIRDSIYRAKYHTNESRETQEYAADSLNYLYYCQQNIGLGSVPLKSRYEISAIGNAWLRNHNRDSVRQVLEFYRQLCNKYKIPNTLVTEDLLEEVFSNPSFNVLTLHSGESLYQLEDVYQNIERLRTGFWDEDIFIGFLYFALGASILLFSFRITRLRPWFTAIIGAIVWCILVGLIVTTIHNGEGVLILLLVIWLFYMGASLIQIFGRSRKIYAGVFFNWFYWSTAFLIPLVMGLIYEATDIPCNNYPDCPPDPPIHTWIQQHFIQINWVNIVFMLILTLAVFIPLAMKWQAKAEE